MAKLDKRVSQQYDTITDSRVTQQYKDEVSKGLEKLNTDFRMAMERMQCSSPKTTVQPPPQHQPTQDPPQQAPPNQPPQQSQQQLPHQLQQQQQQQTQQQPQQQQQQPQQQQQQPQQQKKRRVEEGPSRAEVSAATPGPTAGGAGSGGKTPARMPWWRVKEVKEADREAKRLREAAERAQLVADEKRSSLSAPVGSSGPSVPGPSGVACAGGVRGGPRGGMSVATPRGGRGFRGAGWGRGTGPGFATRGSFVRQPSTFYRPHSTPRPALASTFHTPSILQAPAPQPPLALSAPPPPPASIDSSMLSLLSSLTSSLGEWARQNPAALSSLSGGGAPSPVASVLTPAASPPVQAPVRYLAHDYRVAEGDVSQVTDVAGPARE